MKKLVILVAALSPLAVLAHDETVVRYSTTTVGYAAVKPDGGLVAEHAWEGYKVVKRADGNCYRIEHKNLRIEDAGNGQRAQFDEIVTAVTCDG